MGGGGESQQRGRRERKVGAEKASSSPRSPLSPAGGAGTGPRGRASEAEVPLGAEEQEEEYGDLDLPLDLSDPIGAAPDIVARQVPGWWSGGAECIAKKCGNVGVPVCPLHVPP